MEKYMLLALEQAKLAFKADEVPVGACIVKNNEVIALGHNLKESGQNALHHAEIIAINDACKALNSWRLTDCEIYVTLEPCPMCAGAIIQSRISRVIFGAFDPKAGCIETLYSLTSDKRFNHTCEAVGGVLEDKCSALLTNYFKIKRIQSRNDISSN